MTFARFLMTILTKSVSIMWKRTFSSRNGWRYLRICWALFARSLKVDKENYQRKWRLLYWESSKSSSIYHLVKALYLLEAHVTDSRNGLHMRVNVLLITYVTTGTPLSTPLPLLGSARPLPGATTVILNLNFFLTSADHAVNVIHAGRNRAPGRNARWVN